jgi:hypothetical protein
MEYRDLRFPLHIQGVNTVGELADLGCPKCKMRLFPEASVCFGSLHCSTHGAIWIWIPTKREKVGYTPRAWKNMITQEMSPEYAKSYGR